MVTITVCVFPLRRAEERSKTKYFRQFEWWFFESRFWYVTRERRSTLYVYAIGYLSWGLQHLFHLCRVGVSISMSGLARTYY